FFLTMPISKMIPIMPMTSSGMPNSIRVNSAPSPARGQGRDDCDRVDRALIEHAKDDVDRDQRSENQDRRASQRILKRLRAALETRRDRGRQVELFRGLLDRRHRLADRNLWRKIEAQRHGRELALVVERDRRHRRVIVANWLSGTSAPLDEVA